MTPEQPPRGEHQANGLAEVTGRHIRDQARVMKLYLQHKIGRKVMESEPIMPWLLRWAAMSLSRFQVGQDGKTAYERQKGRKCELEVVPFGEKVLYRLPEVANDRHQALEERWAHGIWLGHARHSPEILIATDSGIVKSWAIRRLPVGQQWDADMVSRVKGSPTSWRLDASEDQEMVEEDDKGDPQLYPQLREKIGSRTGEKRSMYLSRRDFEVHGFTDGCVGCKDLAERKAVPAPDGRGSPKCRPRSLGEVPPETTPGGVSGGECR